MVKVVGAGVGRTGTNSLKITLEKLLGGPCYHMYELIARPDEAPVWTAAAEGNPPDWAEFLAPWSAVVDWPAASFFAELADVFPDALVIHSVRESEDWFASTQRTIFANMDQMLATPSDEPFPKMLQTIFTNTFTTDVKNKDVAIAAYEAHNNRVREQIPSERRLEYVPGQGWGPICERLNLPIPDEPFPHTNSSKNFQETVEAAVAGDPPSGLDKS